MIKLKKWPVVKVRMLDDHYDAKVSVFRHVSNPTEICVYIQGITLRAPRPLVDSADGTIKVVKGGEETVDFSIETTYPYEKQQ